MKLALVACDLLTMVVLWRWLVATGRSEWLTLAYAWNPLVVFEIAHSGHIDALAALWIVAAAFWLARRRTQLASIAFVLAIATKLVPIVLAPLFIGRVRMRDAVHRGAVPRGALPALRLGIGRPARRRSERRRSDPVQRAALRRHRVADVPEVCRRASPWPPACPSRCGRAGACPSTDPAAWAWPMAVAIAFAPVIYPWYLLCLTPFLFSIATLPLAAWTVSALSVYEVWDLSRHGGRWITPVSVMAFEFGVLVVATGRRRRVAAEVSWRHRSQRS